MTTSTWSIRRELLIILLALCISVAALPGLIYVVGERLFGAYGSDGMMGLYHATFTDLMVPRIAAWTLLFAPTLCVILLRVLFHLTAAKPDAPEPRHEPSHEPAPAQATRREPTISS
jgi:hypothetical protein